MQNGLDSAERLVRETMPVQVAATPAETEDPSVVAGGAA
jgi:hypothetical protein